MSELVKVEAGAEYDVYFHSETVIAESEQEALEAGAELMKLGKLTMTVLGPFKDRG